MLAGKCQGLNASRVKKAVAARAAGTVGGFNVADVSSMFCGTGLTRLSNPDSTLKFQVQVPGMIWRPDFAIRAAFKRKVSR
ncbi:hypothetical protein BH11PSE11_BH11PSE11_30390 [soil metagenome]